MTDQNNAAQPVLTDEEIRSKAHAIWGMRDFGALEFARAIESALLSKLSAPVAEPEWIDDPHDIEQGMMRNPKYVAPIADERADNIHSLISRFRNATRDDAKNGGRDYFEAARALESELRQAVDALASAPAPKPWPVEEQPDGTVTPVDPADMGSAPVAVDRQRLRNLVDVVWNEATESTAVPDTPWADRMIDQVFPSVAASAPVAGEQPIKLSDDVLHFLKEGVENATQCEEADVDQEFADQLLLLMYTPLYTEPRPKQREVDWGPLVVAPVAGEAQPDDLDQRLLEATIRDLAAISKHLGLDPNEGGAVPIIEAIEELRRERDEWVDAQYAAAAVAPPQASAAPAAFSKDGVLFWYGDHAARRGFDGDLYLSPQASPGGLMVDIVPPATARDRWMYEQGRLAERDPRSHAAPQASEAVREVAGVTLDGCLETLFRIGEHLGIDYAESRKQPGAPSGVYIKAIEDRISQARDAALDEAATLMDQTSRSRGAELIRALKQPQADKDGGDVALPPLPSPPQHRGHAMFAGSQMLAYARTAVLADRQQHADGGADG